MLWPVRGSVLADRSCPPTCHQSMQYVGRMRVSGAALLSGNELVNMLEHRAAKETELLLYRIRKKPIKRNFNEV